MSQKPPAPPSPNTPAAPLSTRQSARLLLVVAAAGLCWASALMLLFSDSLDPFASLFATPRLIFYVLLLVAGVLTFVPIQRKMNIPGLAVEGIIGVGLFFYTLAFIPAPRGWLLDLPEQPVYLILAAALFWGVSALAMPLVYAAGQRMFRQRARQYDLRRARRQAHEVGAFAAICVLLAGLRLLTPLSALLVVLIVIVAEFLFLSFVETGH